MNTILEVAPALGVLATCAAFGVARASYYRKRAGARTQAGTTSAATPASRLRARTGARGAA